MSVNQQRNNHQETWDLGQATKSLSAALPIRVIVTLALVSSILCLSAGCGSAVRKYYKRQDNAQAVPLADGFEPAINTVFYSNFSDAIDAAEDFKRELGKSYDDYSPAELRTLRGKFLSHLGIYENPSDSSVVGMSVYRHSSTVQSEQGALKSLAKSEGADIVIIGSEYLGSTTKTSMLPITTTDTTYGSGNSYSNLSGQFSSLSSSGYTSGQFSGSSNTYSNWSQSTTSTQFVPFSTTTHWHNNFAVFVRTPDAKLVEDSNASP